MRKARRLVAVMAALVAVAAGCAKANAPQATGGGPFNSRVAFDVYARKALEEEAQLIGRTPSEGPLVIPRCLFWWVWPLPPLDMAKVRAEIQARGIPGLALHGSQGDDDLADLKGLTALQTLILLGTEVTDAGLEHLKGLTALQTLDLRATKVTDAGLQHLEGVTALQTLVLSFTNVTDAGLEHLKGLTPLQTLWLDGTEVSDAGLEHLKGLTALKTLNLWRTKVTDAGVAQLRKALPNANITW